jgi:hypothetical protein
MEHMNRRAQHAKHTPIQSSSSSSQGNIPKEIQMRKTTRMEEEQGGETDEEDTTSFRLQEAEGA